MTAREQATLLAPWRTAAEDIRWVGPLNSSDSDKGGRPGKQEIKYPEATQRVVDNVHAATGVRMDVENTGGNTYVLSGRLEDGSWLVAGDHTDGDIHWDLAHRHREEAEEGPKGWYAAVYHNQVETDPKTGEQVEYWGFHPVKGHSVEPFHIHEDEHGTVHDLPRVVADTIRSIPPGAKHRPDEDGGAPEPAAPREIPDYENLVNPRADLDDDYGDIFGEGR